MTRVNLVKTIPASDLPDWHKCRPSCETSAERGVPKQFSHSRHVQHSVAVLL